ncbi:MAG: polysaccharide pyruvyl transferase family protein [Gammaproteobacteria bacterium]|nr:polysaccharide pyruvyl transferase family protein [Gammaproteobacteria bacterium]
MRSFLKKQIVATVGSRNFMALLEARDLLRLALRGSFRRAFGRGQRYLAWPLAGHKAVVDRRTRKLGLFLGAQLPPAHPNAWIQSVNRSFPRLRELELLYAGPLHAATLEKLGVLLARSAPLVRLSYVFDPLRFRQPPAAQIISALNSLGSMRVGLVAAVHPGAVAAVDELLDLVTGTGIGWRLAVAPEFLALAGGEIFDDAQALQRYDAELLLFRAALANPDAGVRDACRDLGAMLAGERPVSVRTNRDPDDLSWLLKAPPPPRPGASMRFLRKHYTRHWRFRCTQLVRRVAAIPRREPSVGFGARVLVVGWYGTETVGDKAILATVLARLQGRESPPAEIRLASLYPFVTRHSLRELGVSGVTLVETYSAAFRGACETADEIVVGGGPLMDLEALNHILYAFARGARRGARLRVEGCGIGPLRSPLYSAVVGHILRLASEISLRDSAARTRCEEEFGRGDATLSGDPAADYLAGITRPTTEAAPVVACFLREWPMQFSGLDNPAEFVRARQAFERGLERLLAYCGEHLRAEVHLYPMHCFQIGGDDRRFNRALARRLRALCEVPVKVITKPVAPTRVVSVMRNAEMSICMRYHSVLFAETLGVPFVAIDYTCGGKIEGFLNDAGSGSRMISAAELSGEGWEDSIDRLLPA